MRSTEDAPNNLLIFLIVFMLFMFAALTWILIPMAAEDTHKKFFLLYGLSVFVLGASFGFNIRKIVPVKKQKLPELKTVKHK